MNLPNKLTVLRLCMVPVFLLFLCLPLPLSDTVIRIVTAVIFILTSLTDMLDGKIARKYNLITDFGKFMDPLADKFLVIAAMLGILAYCDDLRAVCVGGGDRDLPRAGGDVDPSGGGAEIRSGRGGKLARQNQDHHADDLHLHGASGAGALPVFRGEPHPLLRNDGGHDSDDAVVWDRLPAHVLEIFRPAEINSTTEVNPAADRDPWCKIESDGPGPR